MIKNICLFLSVASLSTAVRADLPDGYQELLAKEKQEILWQKISESPYRILPRLNSAAAPNVLSLSMARLQGAFENPNDEVIPGRKKIIHKFGSSVKFNFEAESANPYSGIFKSGAVGIARLSLALPPKSEGSFVPGMALKFFVDGQPSVNLTVMERLEGQGPDRNFFSSTFTNWLPEPKSLATKVGTWIFERFVNDALHLKVSHLATADRSGTPTSDPVFPDKLFFVPMVSMESRNFDFRSELSKIPPGTEIYEVRGSSGFENQEQSVLIGRIVTSSEFVASPYQDEQLYFQHAGTGLK